MIGRDETMTNSRSAAAAAAAAKVDEFEKSSQADRRHQAPNDTAFLNHRRYAPGKGLGREDTHTGSTTGLGSGRHTPKYLVYH